jgi:hypothetical protein
VIAAKPDDIFEQREQKTKAILEANR